MKQTIIIPILAFSGICISAAGMLFSSSTNASMWTKALLIFLVTGTAALALRAAHNRQPLTSIVAGAAVLLAAAAFFLLVTKHA